MPRITPGGKYIFGWSVVRADSSIRIPDEAVPEYRLAPGDEVILISGSRTSGGVVVANRESLAASALAGVLERIPPLPRGTGPAAGPVRFKGRLYCRAAMGDDGVLGLTAVAAESFGVATGDRLLAIRGSNIAFVLAQKGPLVKKARNHPEIPEFS